MRDENAPNRRRRLGLYARPRAQLLMGLVLGLGFAALGGLMVWMYVSLQTFLQALAASGQISPQTALALNDMVYSYVRAAAVLAGVLAVTGWFLGLKMSKRIYGPMIPIRAHVAHLIRGEYASRVRTRESDEFRDLVAELNQLAETLERG